MLFVNKITGQVDDVPLSIVKPIIKEESFVLAATDADSEKSLRCNSINNIDVFIPNNSDVPFPIGVVITVEQMGNGIVTFKAMPGVIINGTNHSTAEQGDYMQAHKVNVNVWNIIGGA